MIWKKENSPDAAGLNLIQEANEFKKIFHQYWKNHNSFGHWYLEFEICLEFDAWNLRFYRFR